MIRYEHPLNERIRTLMRLEDIFERAEFFASRPDATGHHYALLALFEILDIAARADLKSDLLQELERQRQVLQGLRDNPAISQDALVGVLAEIERASSELHGQTAKFGQHIRDNEWLMSLKQRASIPGGMCEFSLPGYHYWLNRDTTERQADLKEWLSPMLPTQHASAIVLRLLRDSGKPSRQVAYQGTFQLMLGAAKVAQLLRLSLPRHLPCVPEISANKYALNIRFIALGETQTSRPKVYDSDIEFDLTFCTL